MIQKEKRELRMGRFPNLARKGENFFPLLHHDENTKKNKMKHLKLKIVHSIILKKEF